MKRALYCFSFLMLVMALVGGMSWSLDCDSCTATATGVGGDITATGNFVGFRNGEHMHAPVGVEATISGGWSDVDATQYSTTKDTVNPSASGSGWDVTPFENPTDGCWSNISAKKTATQAGTDTIDFHCTDNARCGSLGNDGDLDFSLVVDFVGMSDYKGPDSWYEGDCVAFSVLVGPATHSPDTDTTHGNYVKWYYSIGSSETIQALPAGCSYSYSTSTGRSTCYISSLLKGTYKIYARVETPTTISTGNGPYYTWDVTVYPALPTNVEGTSCSEGGSGGCSSGSCGSSGGGAPTPSLFKPLVSPPSFAIGTYGKDKSGQVCDTQPSFTVIKSCNTVKWYFTSCEGTNVPVSFPQTTTAPPTYSNPYPVQVGTWTLNRIGAQDATSWSYTATSIDGTLYTYDSAPSTDPDVRVTFPALTRIDYPDGTYTTFTDNGSGSYTTSNFVPTSPNPTAIHTTAFTVDSHDRVTSKTGDDGIKVTIDYLAGSITPAYPETVETINTKGTTTTADDEVLSTTEYTYNTDGRISLVDQDDKQTGYTYTIVSGNVTDITVTNLSASPDIVTVYSYAATTTTITQKHPTDSSKDQATVTEFFTHNGEKTYVWKVTDPMGNIVRNGVYIPTGTSTTNKTVDVDYKITSNSLLWGKPFVVEDQNNNETEYEYNASTGTIASINYPDSTTEEYT